MIYDLTLAGWSNLAEYHAGKDLVQWILLDEMERTGVALTHQGLYRRLLFTPLKTATTN